MTVSEFIHNANLKVLTKPDFNDREINGCYVGDLLSWVMGRAEQDNVWITIMSNINIVAVAALVDMSCIVLAEGVAVEDDIIKKADEQGIIILSTTKTCYDMAIDFYRVAK